MNIKTMKAPTPARVDASELQSSPACGSVYPTFPMFLQEPADMVGILSARSRVAPATIRAQFEAWQIGCRS